MKKVLIVGASGYGNIGDDTYRRIFQHHYGKKYDLQFCNSDLPGAVHPAFPKCDAVILGGGGLLYAFPDHFDKMTWYLKGALRAKVPFAMISVGYQFKPLGSANWITEPVKKWAPYVREASLITVRSQSDLQFTQHLGKEDNAFYFPDLCYSFADFACCPRPEKDPKRQICIIPGAGLFQPMKQASQYVWTQQHYTLGLCRLLQELGYTGFRAVRMGAGSDDNPKVALIREFLNDPHIPAVAGNDPVECLRTIAAASVVISGRYHGMVFARSVGVPVITMPAAPYKIWTEDKQLDPKQAVGHLHKLNAFLERV